MQRSVRRVASPPDAPRSPLRPARRLLAAALLVAVAVAGLPSPAGASSLPQPATAEVEFLRLTNQARAGAGLAPLTRDSAADAVAREWSGVMAREGRLYHRPDLGTAITTRITPTWTRGGENVGVGGSVPSLHDAFMGSPGHRANKLGDFNRVGVGVVTDGSRIWVTYVFVKGPAITGDTGTERPVNGAMWLASTDGGVFAVNAPFFGSLGGVRLAQPVVGMAPTPSAKGYWLVARDGGIFTFGDARFFGSTGAMRLNQPVVGMAATPTGNGYWLVARDGGIFTFGDARFRGSTGNLRLNQPILGMAPTRSGNGYWLFASDGGIFTFGDARFHGSTGNLRLVQPIVGMTPTPTGRGYWMVARDGGIFTFGDARFLGSLGGRALPAPIVGMSATATGNGYRLVDADGRVYSFGDAGSGNSGRLANGAPVVAAAGI